VRNERGERRREGLLIFFINPDTSAELMFQMVENLLSPTLSSFVRKRGG
jgi:hypothetical protein